jgi:hypothetical protein
MSRIIKIRDNGDIVRIRVDRAKPVYRTRHIYVETESPCEDCCYKYECPFKKLVDKLNNCF